MQVSHVNISWVANYIVDFKLCNEQFTHFVGKSVIKLSISCEKNYVIATPKTVSQLPVIEHSYDVKKRAEKWIYSTH